MPSFLDLLVVAGMFLLRFGIPAAVVGLLAYGLKRLDARWEREAREYAAQHASEQPAAPRPGVPARKPAPTQAPSLPFVPPPAIKDQRPQIGIEASRAPAAREPGKAPADRQVGMVAASQHCYDVKSCSPEQKAACPASQQTDKPCWQVRFSAEGHIPEDCVQCDVFQRYPTM